MNKLTKDMLIAIRDHCTYSDFANLLATCKRYLKYKCLLQGGRFQPADLPRILMYLQNVLHNIEITGKSDMLYNIFRTGYHPTKEDFCHKRYPLKIINKIFSVLVDMYNDYIPEKYPLMVLTRFEYIWYGKLSPAGDCLLVDVDKIRILDLPRSKRSDNSPLIALAFVFVVSLLFMRKLSY